jgi:DNA repair exonuclease SbcCD ATPase subunit
MPDHCSGSEKGDEVDPFSNNLGPHPRVSDLIAGCDFARIEISRVISLLAVQRSADSKHNYTMLKKQQAFREELSDRVTELRKEYEPQLENLYKQLQREKVAHDHTKAFNGLYLRLHSKREHSLQQEVEKRKDEVIQLQKDIYSLQRKVRDTEALKEELFRPADFKEWVLQWFSRGDISRVTGTILETRYRNAMKDLDKVIAQMEVLATQSDLVNQHAELLQYICSRLFKLDSGVAAAPLSAHSNKKDRRLVKPISPA